MASTRNKNTIEDYSLEQYKLNKESSYLTYEHSGKALQTYLPGNGLLAGKVAHTELSKNYTDIESFLYGIGSTNLVTPSRPPVAEIKGLKSLNIIDKTPVIIPEPLYIQSNQRPFRS
jgi:hypothetical protein